MLNGLILFFNSYRNTGVKSTKIIAKDLTVSISGTFTVFKKKRASSKKKMFNYETRNELPKNEKRQFIKILF